MLNPNLNLNQNIFENPEKKATRDGFGEALVELGKQNSNVVVLSADLRESTRVEEFAKEFPDRFFEVGVAEQNMAAIAAGLGVSGKIPFISSYAVFSPGKNWETIRTTIAYNIANVKIAGHHAGIITGADGATHQATEDLALMRTLPNLTIYVPSDSIEAKKATLESARVDGPVYIRLSREKTPILTSENTFFNSGAAQIFWISQNPSVTLFATGHVLYYALLAAKKLENEGINSLVINVSVIKPLDINGIVEAVSKTKAAVTIEDHQIAGGLAGLISEVMAKLFPIPIEFVGIKNLFGESGQAEELIKKYEIDENAIEYSAKRAIARKSA